MWGSKRSHSNETRAVPPDRPETMKMVELRRIAADPHVSEQVRRRADVEYIVLARRLAARSTTVAGSGGGRQQPVGPGWRRQKRRP